VCERRRVGIMRRHSLESKLTNRRLYAKLLHECWACHAVGLKPGVLETHLGDYGMRDFLGTQYGVLDLSTKGLCSACEKSPPPEIAPLVSS
jgi:hypothetical protein